MRLTSIASLTCFALLALGTACGPSASEPGDRPQRPKVWPKATPPPPPSPIYHDIREPMPSEQDIEREAGEYTARLEEELGRAMLSGDVQRREAMIVFVLPELLQVEPQRVLDLLARMEPGAPRDLLRIEVAQQWVSQDASAAIRWMSSLEGEERRSAVLAAVNTLMPSEPRQARELARKFDLRLEEPPHEPLAAERH